jgi:hypothetical protein
VKVWPNFLEKKKINYIIEYSNIKNKFYLFLFIFFTVPVVVIIISILNIIIIKGKLQYYFNNNYIEINIAFIIAILLIWLPIYLFLNFKNYKRDKNNCIKYKLEVNDNNVIFNDLINLKEIRFSIKQAKYTEICFGTRSFYEAIKVEFDNKKIVIYNTMKNYYTFKKQINKLELKEIFYIIKPNGYLEENIL